MGFASSWIAEKALFPQLFKEVPDKRTGIIVVIPAYNEPGITTLLDSLLLCDEPGCGVEIIIVINSPADADPESLEGNLKCYANIESWITRNKKCFFRLYVFNAGKPLIPGWGVGLARKTGMDEAVRRFDYIDHPGGVIVNLDADCKVGKNYFVELFRELAEKKERTACSIYFEHPLSGTEFHYNIYWYITLYELHMRYYLQGLKYSGFPYSFHTVGSALAVKALPYIKSGGMNRRKAGEDFYFIQKLVHLPGYFYLNTTTVYPSPRESSRVPFGTGPAITRMTGSNEASLMTYNVEAFSELKLFFHNIKQLFGCGKKEGNEFYKDLPQGLRSFIDEKEWSLRIAEINRNTSGAGSFEKRFFSWFNMFRIVKYKNHVHAVIYEKRPVNESASALLKIMGMENIPGKASELLQYYRNLEKIT